MTKPSPHCSGDKNTCSWGSCFECDSDDRVYINYMNGKTVTAQFRKGDDGWVYRLDGEIHGCSDVDAQDRPECAYINEQAARLIS